MIRILLIFSALIIACGSSISYGDYVDTSGWSRKQIESIKNHPNTQIGIASYYGKKFHKKRTANGEIFDELGVTAAHKTLPLGTTVKVINLDNNNPNFSILLSFRCFLNSFHLKGKDSLACPFVSITHLPLGSTKSGV